MLPITRKLVRLYFNLPGKPVDLYFEQLQKLIKNNGYVYTIKYMKSVRLHITRYICHSPLFINDAGVAVDKKGWPKAFGFLKPLLKSIDGKRVLFTLILLPRGLIIDRKKLNLKVDYSTIYRPSKAHYTVPT